MSSRCKHLVELARQNNSPPPQQSHQNIGEVDYENEQKNRSNLKIAQAQNNSFIFDIENITNNECDPFLSQNYAVNDTLLVESEEFYNEKISSPQNAATHDHNEHDQVIVLEIEALNENSVIVEENNDKQFIGHEQKTDITEAVYTLQQCGEVENRTDITENDNNNKEILEIDQNISDDILAKLLSGQEQAVVMDITDMLINTNEPEETTRPLHEENYIEGSIIENDVDNAVDSADIIEFERDNIVNTSDDEFVPVRRQEKLLAKKRRVEGRSYTGYKVIGKKVSQTAPKAKREIKSRCNHTINVKKSNRSFCCGMISEDQRKVLFDKFWLMKTWSEKKGYVQGLVNTRGINRRRKTLEEIESNKKNTGHDIFLDSANNERFRVCRKFFINTLGIGEDTFKRWTKRTEENITLSRDEGSESPVSISKPKTRRQEKKENDLKSIRAWLDLLPKVPSHYCRQSSQKLYVEPVFHSKRHMHSIYEQWCNENKIKPAIRTIFCDTLKTQKVAIHKPRKDQCDTCVGHKEGNITQEIYEAHIARKNQAREEKNQEKASASDTKKVITMDLQSNLLCPISLASSMYYKQKLTVHNFTIRELNDGHVRLYVWHEVDGGVGANEFSSCIVDYILELPVSITNVVLISDGCCSQNRNRILSTALLDTARQKNIIIEQLYLQRGHTMMEADNVHATLEHYFKPPIYSPMDYVSRMHLARPNKPYEVKVVHYDFFKNYSKMDSVLASIRPGTRVGEKCVTDICKIKYLPDNTILIKTDFSEDWKSLPHRRHKVDCFSGLRPLYENEIPLRESKYKDLQSLKSVIDRQYHEFYNNLPYKPDKKCQKTEEDNNENNDRPPKKKARNK